MGKSHTFIRLSLWMVLAVLLGSCALKEAITGSRRYAPGKDMLGQSPQEVIFSLGKPAAQLTIPRGARLVFVRGPFGRHSYFVDFDEANRMVAYEQVLTPERFARINPGMTRQEVIEIIGPSTEIRGLAFKREVWSWRYENFHCWWFQVEFEPTGLARSAGNAPLPECRGRSRAGLL